jgi:hypothetical protein
VCEADGTNHQTEIEPESARPDGACEQSEAATGKSIAPDTFDDEDDADTNAVAVWQSNSETIKEAHYGAIGSKQRFALGASLTRLKPMRKSATTCMS